VLAPSVFTMWITSCRMNTVRRMEGIVGGACLERPDGWDGEEPRSVCVCVGRMQSR
jgi:hypothetical protein